MDFDTRFVTGLLMIVAAGLTFVLDGPDGVEVVPGVDPAEALAALGDMR